MGKRKKAQKKVVKRVVPKLAQVFDCPLCNQLKCCNCKIDYMSGVATIECTECGQSHRCKATNLTQGVDVYADWIDNLEIANNGIEEYPLQEQSDGEYSS
ncbi:hypothetical protein WA158_001624 [Blastocystis sp. Blastoise]